MCWASTLSFVPYVHCWDFDFVVEINRQRHTGKRLCNTVMNVTSISTFNHPSVIVLAELKVGSVILYTALLCLRACRLPRVYAG